MQHQQHTISSLNRLQYSAYTRQKLRTSSEQNLKPDRELTSPRLQYQACVYSTVHDLALNERKTRNDTYSSRDTSSGEQCGWEKKQQHALYHFVFPPPTISGHNIDRELTDLERASNGTSLDHNGSAKLRRSENKAHAFISDRIHNSSRNTQLRTELKIKSRFQHRNQTTSTQTTNQADHAHHRLDYALRPAQSLQLSLQSPEQYALPRTARTSTAQLIQLSSDLKADNSLGIAQGTSTKSLCTPTDHARDRSCSQLSSCTR
ncbi:hypothetical protein F511_32130 [Dorcoceras hygrometricum]|uniref:Uncharacterized protein n=1 Tax=Dorcoceras hygrometricum TaxID=472368 RepID=A0A2Z7AQM6_9LAMI|nr:hypothetical protein F511_32130 [Dorcoceras hygrometricum]